MDERAAAEALAARLDLRVATLDACPACLFAVSSALESGEPREVRRAMQFVAPLLWDEGLDAPVRIALAAARDEGVGHAGAATADLEARGPRSFVFLAIVKLLARRQGEEASRAYMTSQN